MQMLALAETRLAMGYAEIPMGGGEWSLSAGFRRLLGIADGQENLVNAVAAAFHVDDRHAFLEAISLMRGGHAPVAKTYGVTSLQASANRIALQFAPIEDADGIVQTFICLARDVSASAALAQSAAEADARLDRLMEIMDIDCFWRADDPGNLFDYRLRRHLRRDVPFLGRAWLEMVPPAERERIVAKVDAARALERPYRIILPFVGNDGVLRDYVSSGYPIRDESGRVTEWCGVVRHAGQEEGAARAVGASVQEAVDYVTGATVKGLCALFGWTYEEVSRLSGLSLTTINRFSGSPGPLIGRFRRKSIESFLHPFARSGAAFLIQNESDLFICRRESSAAVAETSN